MWREYVILVRSLPKCPATHFVSVNFQPWYTGRDITNRMNTFVKLLRKRVGCGEITFIWRYDSQVKGRWPHAHMLLRAAATITDADVLGAWRETWPDELLSDTDAHVRACDDDHIETARYYTKHHEPQNLVTKAEWCGRLLGGTMRFFIAAKKVLFEDEYYTEGQETREYAELLERFTLWWGSRVTADTSTCTTAEQALGEDCGSSLFYFSPPILTEPTTGQLPLDLRPRPPANFRVNLPHCLLPIPPPRLVDGRGREKKE